MIQRSSESAESLLGGAAAAELETSQAQEGQHGRPQKEYIGHQMRPGQLSESFRKKFEHAGLINATANATANARVRQAEADAAGLKELKAAEQQRFQDLKDSASMSSEDMLRYVWLDNLKSLDGTKMFIDYKKVPMFLESLT
mmetsp:Transcript_149594/g.363353  ORF Transcript_149594/g.363353 Transcript_149594/m.363353 type:complete len:142 (-) Transcript_149594:48-473(-)